MEGSFKLRILVVSDFLTLLQSISGSRSIGFISLLARAYFIFVVVGGTLLRILQHCVSFVNFLEVILVRTLVDVRMILFREL